MIRVKFKKLDENAIIPFQKNITDAGIDFYSVEEKSLSPGDKTLVSTGLAWEPEFYRYQVNSTIADLSFFCNFKNFYKIYMKLFSRSGYASKHGIEVGAGVIDQEYRGEIKVLLYNFGERYLTINKGSKIAQGIVYIVPHIEIFEADQLSITVRNTNGFGSSGG